MNVKASLLFLCLLTGLQNAFSQTNVSTTYTLLSGSQLTDDCPICDRLPIVVPIKGTFVLRSVGQDPFYGYYEIEDANFQTSDSEKEQYKAVGTGTYRIGGDFALLHDMFLDLQVDNGSMIAHALCTSDRVIATQSWSGIQISVHQTNGTPSQVISLDLVAAPQPRFTSITFEPTTGDVQLSWEGTATELERATNAAGPFVSLGNVTEQTFIDTGILTNQVQSFYRLKR